MPERPNQHVQFQPLAQGADTQVKGGVCGDLLDRITGQVGGDGKLGGQLIQQQLNGGLLTFGQFQTVTQDLAELAEQRVEPIDLQSGVADQFQHLPA